MQQNSVSVSSTDQVTKSAQPLVKNARILHCLMHDAEPLSTEVLWRDRDDDKVGSDQRVPTALVKIRWTIKQNDVEATRRLEFFQKCTQDVGFVVGTIPSNRNVRTADKAFMVYLSCRMSGSMQRGRQNPTAYGRQGSLVSLSGLW